MRRILHMDMDAFFASVEQRENPDLRGRPVAVGGTSNRGVVAAASYEARAYGVRSAMPSVQARRLCPGLIFLPTRFALHAEVSRHVHGIFRRYADRIEPLSLDEAYLDVTHPLQGGLGAIRIARRIRREIRAETELTISAGVSYNKFLAKMASEADKPDGFFVIRPADADAFLAQLPIESFPGVGRVTAARMKEMGIHSGADLRACDERELLKRFGKKGLFLYRMAREDDRREVKPDRIPKSIGAERTFARNLKGFDALQEPLGEVVDRVIARMQRLDMMGRTVTLKIRYFDFTIRTRSVTLSRPVRRREELRTIALDLLRRPEPGHPRSPAWPFDF